MGPIREVPPAKLAALPASSLRPINVRDFATALRVGGWGGGLAFLAFVVKECTRGFKGLAIKPSAIHWLALASIMIADRRMKAGMSDAWLLLHHAGESKGLWEEEGEECMRGLKGLGNKPSAANALNSRIEFSTHLTTTLLSLVPLGHQAVHQQGHAQSLC